MGAPSCSIRFRASEMRSAWTISPYRSFLDETLVVRRQETGNDAIRCQWQNIEPMREAPSAPTPIAVTMIESLEVKRGKQRGDHIRSTAGWRLGWQARRDLT